jgi:adenylate kinase family enzyme
MTRPFVIVITGPTGVGKTTLALMLSKHYGCPYISEDEIARNNFPTIYQNIENYPDKVRLIANQLFKEARKHFDAKKSVVIDRINLEKEFIENMQKTFHRHLILKVLWPPIEVTIERDRKREGWTSGENAVKAFYQKYEELKPIIGEENYIDNSGQTPKEVLGKLVANIEKY